jgi:hypothetical protein
MVESFGSCTSSDYVRFLGAARRYGPKRPDKAAELHPGIVNLLGAEYLIFPSDFEYAHAPPPVPVGDNSLPENAALWQNPGAYPRVWIVHDVLVLPHLGANDPISVDRRTRQVLFPDGTPREFRETAIVETNAKIEFPVDGQARITSTGGDQGERCQIVTYEPERLKIQVRLQRPGLLVVSDTFYPGWVAEVRSGDGPRVATPILQTNRIMRGVVLPAGAHEIVFAYRPRPFYVGATISAVGWFALLIGFAAGLWRRRKTALPAM